MDKNYKIAVWERDCEKIQDQFTSHILAEKIKYRQGSVVVLIATTMIFAACIAGLYFTREDAQLLTQISCICLFGLSLNLFILGMLIKHKIKKIEDELTREENLQIFYNTHKDGVITRIKYIQDRTVTYEIKSNDGSTFNWKFTVDKVEQVDNLDMYIIHATDNIVKIEVPANNF